MHSKNCAYFHPVTLTKVLQKRENTGSSIGTEDACSQSGDRVMEFVRVPRRWMKEEERSMKSNRMRAFSILFLWLFLCPLGRAQEGETAPEGAEVLSLQQAVHLALQGNPRIQAARLGRDASQARLDQARSQRLPGLEFSETYTHSNNPVFVFGSLLEQGQFGPHNFELDALNQPGAISNFRSSLDLNLPIFNRFKISAEVEKARLSDEQAQADVRWSEQQIRFQVIEAYYGVLLAREARDVATQAVASAEAEVERLQNLRDQGLVVSSDLLSMEVQLAEFQQQEIEAEGDERVAEAFLSTVLSQPLDRRYQVHGQLEERDFTIGGESQLIQGALRNRPDYQKLETMVRQREQDIRSRRGQYLPDLNLFANYGLSGHDLASGSGDFAVGARLTFGLFDGGRGPRISESVALQESARAEARGYADQVRLEVVRALQNYRSARERLAVASRSVDQATETLRIVKDRHGVGLTTITEVLRAQTTLVRTRLNHLNARYQHYLGYAQLLLATGELLDTVSFEP